MFDRVVVPLDGSDFSRGAIPHAVSLADSGTIDLVSSVEWTLPLGSIGVFGHIAVQPQNSTGSELAPVPDLLEESRRAREQELEAIAGELRRTTVVDVRCTVLTGEPSDAVAAHVERTGASLVVLCTHGRGGLERAWLGSTADRLVRQLTVPALLIRPAEGQGAGTIRRVLVPLDGSPLAEAALGPAVEAAKRWGRGVLLLRVVEKEPWGTPPYLPPALANAGRHVEAAIAESTQYLQAIATRLQSEGTRITGSEVRVGKPARVISETARAESAVVAMATHGRGGPRRWLLGSVSDKVVRSGTQPVLLVHPGTAA